MSRRMRPDRYPQIPLKERGCTYVIISPAGLLPLVGRMMVMDLILYWVALEGGPAKM